MQDRVAVISGAARGIGAATAVRFASERYQVVGLDIVETEGPLASNTQLRVCDVSDEASVVAAVEAVLSEFGRIDTLVNVAGVVLVKPLTETRWEDYRRIVDVNIGGTFLMLKHVLPAMQRQKSGAVINVGSVSGHVGQIDHSLYGSTKAAVIALCRSLAWEMAPYGIRINSVSPGSVDTDMLRGDIAIESRATGTSFEAVKAKREAEQALGRWAAPAEIASAIFFLASSEASFVTGTDWRSELRGLKRQF